MELSDVIITKILELLNKNNMTVFKLSTKSGVPRSTLSKLLSRKTKTIRLENLLYICEAFNITLGDFFSDPRFKDVEAKEWIKAKK